MTVYLESNQVPAYLRGAYSGSKFRAEPSESVFIPFDAGLWDGGSRAYYSAIELSTGRALPIPGQSSAPWDKSRTELRVDLKPGFAIVCHRMFKGTDMGLTFYVHPADIAALIPADTSESLTDSETMVLAIIRSRKSAYRADEYRRKGISDGEAESIKARLIRDGYLNKAGAITVKGRNACDKIYV
jgi:hypothetical protein